MIGVLLIATGDPLYTGFVPGILDSLKRNFPPHQVVLFTDIPDYRRDVVVIEQEALGWPRASLMRYHIFLKHQNLLWKYSHLFYLDIDMSVVNKIEIDEICGAGITAVLHPGFVDQYPKAYCRDMRSTAGIQGEDREYYQGSFQGGSTKSYLDMAAVIRHNIDVDDSSGVIPEWYDEAHLNRYLYDQPPVIALPPTFAYPEKPDSYPSVLGKEPRIIHLAKDGQEGWKGLKNGR